MSLEENSKTTLERLRRAAGLGIKVSAIYTAGKLSPNRIKSLVANFENCRYTKILTDHESEVINAELDKIKDAL